MRGWNRAAWKSWLLPGAALLAVAAIVLQGGWPAFSAAAIGSYYYIVFGAGLLLAWRFHSSRVLFTLLTLLLAHRALGFFSGTDPAAGPGRTAFEFVALLLPVNFVILSEMRERGLNLSAAAPRLGVLFTESVLAAILCRPERTASPAILHFSVLPESWFSWTGIPQPALAAFVAAFVLLLTRYEIYRKPVESGMLWSLAAVGLALHSHGGLGTRGSAYFATAGLIIACSVIENFYVLAYHDELTSLPSRRAFNDALLRLEAPFAVAAVDIDHFKSFNDTYGHDVGDQVLRMVAGKLARVSGGGQAFRVGGEEFSILFPGKTAKDVVGDLELLRAVVEQSVFLLRTAEERRSAPRGPDRRSGKRTKSKRAQAGASGEQNLSVTVSIGVAEPKSRSQEVAQVIRAADKALYQAKQSGRNRVQGTDSPSPRTIRASRRHIA